MNNHEIDPRLQGFMAVYGPLVACLDIQHNDDTKIAFLALLNKHCPPRNSGDAMYGGGDYFQADHKNGRCHWVFIPGNSKSGTQVIDPSTRDTGTMQTLISERAKKELDLSGIFGDHNAPGDDVNFWLSDTIHGVYDWAQHNAEQYADGTREAMAVEFVPVDRLKVYIYDRWTDMVANTQSRGGSEWIF